MNCPSQLALVSRRIRFYQRCPFAKDSVPGNVLQHILASVRGDSVLETYDFVDNISSCGKVGWQVKSTKEETPVTWKRAKIPDKETLIAGSRTGKPGLQRLGDSIIEFCNSHALESFERYGLDEIWLARLMIRQDGRALFYQRRLCTRSNPTLFDKRDYTWQWSTPKQSKTGRKEQLQALHGIDREGRKCWAWHGLGENQLHFAGERLWWPATSNDGESHLWFCMPDHTHRMDWAKFTDALAAGGDSTAD